MELQEKILNAAIDVFQEKGLKFTMDDVAKKIKISKKTLYQVFATKEEMLLALADYCFADIKRSEKEVLLDESLSTLDKLKKIMIVLPERYQNIGLSKLYELKEKFPDVYMTVAKYLETDWDATISLLEKGMEEGSIKKLPIPVIKAMVEGTIQHFFASPVLVESNLSYEEGLQQMLDIIFDGIVE
ncbi:MAG: TetR/AcrR family transcriptional regulator [Lachnospiraceae bacterium]|nr:TetR/AcrR family transcriptional regulator [Lachnospiraceae bacterium]